MACALLCGNSRKSSEHHTSSDWDIASFDDVISEDRFRISETKKERSDKLKQNRRPAGQIDRLFHDLNEEIKPYSRAKDIPFTNRAHSSYSRKKTIILQQKHKVTRPSNSSSCTAGNLPAFDVLDANDDFFIRDKTISIHNGTLLLTNHDCTENTQGKTRDFPKILTTTNLELSDKAKSEAEKDKVLTVDNETCQSMRKKQPVKYLEETSCDQIKRIRDTFIGGHYLSSGDSLNLSNLCGGTVPLHDFPQDEDIVDNESGTLSFTDLDIFLSPNEDSGIDSESPISTGFPKQTRGAEEEQTSDITLENTLIDLGIDVELGDSSENHKSDENSDLEDFEGFSSEEEPTDNTDGFQADLAKLVGESNSSKSITPLIKKELQYKIQYQRLERGDEELKLDPGSPIVYKLTEEEIRKKNNRREQNRRSAVKARARAKEHAMKLKQVIQKRSSEYVSLQAEQRKLSEMKSELLKVLNEHLHVAYCTNHTLIKEVMSKMSDISS